MTKPMPKMLKIMLALVALGSLSFCLLVVGSALTIGTPWDRDYENMQYYKGIAAELNGKIETGTYQAEVDLVLKEYPFIMVRRTEGFNGYPRYQLSMGGDPTNSGAITSCEMQIQFVGTVGSRVSDISETASCSS